MPTLRYLPQHAQATGPVTVAHAVALYCCVAFALTMTYPVLRVLTYAIPPLCVIAMLAGERFTLPQHAAPFLVLIVSGLAYSPIMPLVGWQDLYLMLIGLSPFFFGVRYRFPWFAVFAVSVVALVISLAVAGGPSSAGVEFDALNSKSSFESSTSFVFGLLAVWAALQRRPGRALLALLLCILTLKRIVVLGAVLAIVVAMLPRRLVDWIVRPLPMIVLNALYLWVVVLYAQGQLDLLIYQLTGQSGNQFGMGRQHAYQYPIQQLLKHPVESVFYGIGPGGIYDLMKGGWTFLSKTNLHNDSLKVLVEYGGLVWAAFVAALYWPSDRRVRILMLFFNVLLLTDNSLIYTYVIFGLGLALASLAAPAVPTEDAAPAEPAAPPGRAVPTVAGPVHRPPSRR
jgi:hypothetical protein